MEVRTVSVPTIRAAGIEHRGPYHELGTVWGRFNDWLGRHPQLIGRETKFMSVYFDDPEAVSEQELRSLAAISVDGAGAPPEDLSTTDVGGGECAVTTYRGPYEGLGAAWTRLIAWAGEAGRATTAAPCFEIYLNDPRSVAPEDLLTDLYLPLAG